MRLNTAVRNIDGKGVDLDDGRIEAENVIWAPAFGPSRERSGSAGPPIAQGEYPSTIA